MEAANAAEHLRETATTDRVGERAASRLLEVRELFLDDMCLVEDDLHAIVLVGQKPATLAASHLLAAGGKRVRPLCALLSAACFGSSEEARAIAAVAELVHLATLLHDDVIDDADLRRGAVVARRVWGNAVSVLAGDLLLTHALEKAAASSPSAMVDLIATLRRLVDGEVIQLRGRTEIVASEATYFAIVEGKTASLFAWTARSGARSAGAPDALVAKLGEFGHHVGIAFQLVDDALDYAGAEPRIGKRLLSDLREGKVTLPLVFAMTETPTLAPLLGRAREGDAAATDKLLRGVQACHGAERTRARAEAHTKSALDALSALPPSKPRELLAAVAIELCARAV